MKNKKAIMTVSALLILMFHCHMNIFGRDSIETFIRTTAYIGVDIFFCVSAYSIGLRTITDVKSFAISRLTGVYIKFILWIIAGGIVLHFSILRMLQNAAFIELFVKGGGAFLWFLPAILIFYCILYLYQVAFDRFGVMSTIVLVTIWLITSTAISLLTHYTAIFIFWNRLPITIIGWHAGRCVRNYNHNNSKDFIDASNNINDQITSSTSGAHEILCKLLLNSNYILKLITGLLLYISGMLILYKWGYRLKLTTPFPDMFYIIAIPAALGLILICDCIPDNKITSIIGSVTLEMYAIQMIFGTKIAATVYKTTKSAVTTDVVMLTAVLVFSYLSSRLYDFVHHKIKQLIKKHC